MAKARRPKGAPKTPSARKKQTARPPEVPASESAGDVAPITPEPEKKKRTRKRKPSAEESAHAAEIARGRGRPPKTPTAEQIALVQKYAMLNMNYAEIAMLLDMHPHTFLKYRAEFFDAAIERGRAHLKMSSNLVLHREMQKGNMTAVIWLQKTQLGVTEKVHTIVSNPEGGPVEHNVRHSGAIAVGLFLPPNGRDVPAEGQEIPAHMQVGIVPAGGAIALPVNSREVATLPHAEP